MKPRPALPAARTTAFVNGDQFLATQTVQGMVAGKRYIVIDKNERATAFGTFVAYFVNEVATGTPFWVKNLHLLATAVPGPEDLQPAVYCEKCGADCTMVAERGDPRCPGCGDPEPWDRSP
jgi:hypothetical protein